MNDQKLMLACGAMVALMLASCGGDDSVASKSAAAYREAQAKGTPVTGGHDHGEHDAASGTAADHSAHGTAPDAHAGMNHGATTDAHAGMDHGATGAADHSAHGGSASGGAHTRHSSGGVDHAAMGHGTPARGGTNAHAQHGSGTAQMSGGHQGHSSGSSATARHDGHAGMRHGGTMQHQQHGGSTSAGAHAQHGMTTPAQGAHAQHGATTPAQGAHAQHGMTSPAQGAHAQHGMTTPAQGAHAQHGATTPAQGAHAAHAAPAGGAIVPAPVASSAIAQLRPSATLRPDAFDAPAPIAVAEAAKAAGAGDHEGHETRGIVPGSDHENPPTPMPAIRDNLPPAGSAHDDHSPRGTQEPRNRGTRAPGSGTTQVIYACPMHPEVTSDRPGTCPKCGMALVQKR